MLTSFRLPTQRSKCLEISIDFKFFQTGHGNNFRFLKRCTGKRCGHGNGGCDHRFMWFFLEKCFLNLHPLMRFMQQDLDLFDCKWV